MGDTKKLSRAEACVELALRIDPFLSPAPDYFASRDSAAELVAFITDFQQRRAFMDALTVALQLTEVDYEINYTDDDFFKVILATPEQITLAACSALGIEVE